MDLSIIIVNWNSKDYLSRCIASILKNTSGISYEIVVIDSGSFDSCGEMLQKYFPSVRFIQSDANLGFARANNRAVQDSDGECILFLNPDTELIESAINTMYHQLNTLPDAGIIGAKLLNSDGTIQTSCIQPIPTILNQLIDSEFLRARWPKSVLWGMAPLYETATTPQEVEVISGACLMLKRSVFELSGGFCEDYFMYGEDIELSYRVRSGGFKNYYVPEAMVTHFGGTSTAKQPASQSSVIMMRESVWRFLKKTRGRVYGTGYRMGMFVSAIGRMMFLAVILLMKVKDRDSSGFKISFNKWWRIMLWSLNLQTPGLWSLN
jgi:N-acetylglucosaminyl-diphospho-decaprenol L-rhamnosyltransferase